ncbi:MAG: hypothetical protein HN919_12390 [Verrucomicrobia bacterium]|jgi:ectoine hydroxylase-related dioxygenase (phytanoyl-CoA dioxygenase family)|nr:hypothetical protein [Verrucomicrobiota bacterium]MBT7699230.1 hypothetical protein [Verrucomicrobiota bacterium]
MAATLTDEQREHFEREGYVVAHGAVHDDLVVAMIGAIERIINRALDGEFGDTFRWIGREQKVPGFMNDLLTAEKYDPAIGEFLEQVIVPDIESLLGEPVRLSWLLLLTAGAGNPAGVPLHRDNNESGGVNEKELIERFQMKNCLFMAPLLPDDRFLQIVPGSHLRLATEQEIAAARALRPCAVDQVEGMTTIEMQPGDVLYHHTNLLHQGLNPSGSPRWTLLSGLWAASMPLLDIEQQDHALVGVHGFKDVLPERCRAAVERYLEAFGNSPREVTADGPDQDAPVED